MSSASSTSSVPPLHGRKKKRVAAYPPSDVPEEVKVAPEEELTPMAIQERKIMSDKYLEVLHTEIDKSYVSNVTVHDGVATSLTSYRCVFSETSPAIGIELVYTSLVHPHREEKTRTYGEIFWIVTEKGEKSAAWVFGMLLYRLVAMGAPMKSFDAPVQFQFPSPSQPTTPDMDRLVKLHTTMLVFPKAKPADSPLTTHYAIAKALALEECNITSNRKRR